MSGDMLVRSATPYQLRMNGVVWEPIASTDEGDTYILTSGGRCTIFTDDRLAFYFTNEYQEDFEFGYIELARIDASSQVINPRLNNNGAYIQGIGRLVQETASITVTMTCENRDAIIELGATLNQEGAIVDVSTYQASRIQYRCRNFDPSKPLYLKAGNVLLFFLTPRD